MASEKADPVLVNCYVTWMKSCMDLVKGKMSTLFSLIMPKHSTKLTLINDLLKKLKNTEHTGIQEKLLQ